MTGSLLDRQPCPDRILDDAGGGFAMGAVGGSVYHFAKGLRNSPNGARMIGGMQAARMNAPRVGGAFAVWSALFSAFDCTTVFVRQKEDPWNSIIAGAATGGVLSLRRGLRATGGAAFFGAVFLAGIEGVGIMTNRLAAMEQNLPPLPANDPNPNANIATGLPQPPVSYTDLSSSGSSFPQPPVNSTEVASSSGRGSWLGGLFCKEEKKKPSSSGGMSEVLESFETPSPPIPSFEYK